MTTVSATADL